MHILALDAVLLNPIAVHFLPGPLGGWGVSLNQYYISKLNLPLIPGNWSYLAQLSYAYRGRMELFCSHSHDQSLSSLISFYKHSTGLLFRLFAVNLQQRVESIQAECPVASSTPSRSEHRRGAALFR